MDHSDTEQSFCQYSVKHVHILTEDNRVNHRPLWIEDYWMNKFMNAELNTEKGR